MCHPKSNGALLLALCGALAAPAAAGGPSCGATEFLAPYGLQNFSQHYIDALDTFLCVEQQYEVEDYLGAQATLDALWSQHPTGGNDWGWLPWQPFGINIGAPPCYYSLRMLSDMTSWRVANPDPAPPPRTARLTVLVVGQTSGIEPQNEQDIIQGTGVPVVHTLDPRVAADGFAVVHESLHLFKEYALTAITQGLLGVETNLVMLPTVDLPVHAYVHNGSYYATLDYGALSTLLWPALSEEDIAETDWWWLLYPSHVPEQHPDFVNTAFITGGMGTGPDAISPMFIIDDRWLVRKPAHLGSGEYTSIERRAYLPQWLQHEFFHHLYREYPEFGLEETGHQWFDPANWPPDFEGQYEPDYYHESLYKRLHGATPPLHVKLRYATAGAPWDEMTLDDVIGTYHREPVENPWHIGDIEFSGSQLQWHNTAPVTWNLTDDLANGKLLTGPDCPYYGNPNGQQFDIVLEQDEFGDFTTEVAGFVFLNELYVRQPDPCPEDLDGSGAVGFGDVLSIIGAWGPCAGACPHDLNGNGTVDFADILAVIAAWGPC
ncbi:MAG: hypothetical protein ACYTGP_09905 [Planctomycetota bacterium]|jgi:hypothetical protein